VTTLAHVTSAHRSTGRAPGGDSDGRVKATVKRTLKGMLARAGYTISSAACDPYPDLEPQFFELYERCKHFTQTSIERMYALYKATEYVARSGLPGDVVECGVWKGGSAMLSALTLLRLGDMHRHICLYDTFKGMPGPTARDGLDVWGRDARDEWLKRRAGEVNEWCYSSLEEVRQNMESTGFPADRLTYIEGKVEETIPREASTEIAILRLDTDWYESTWHELVHLYPRLVPGGVLIVDDFGHWSGARDATLEYFEEQGAVLLSRVDYTGRLVVKVGESPRGAPGPPRPVEARLG